MAQDARSPPPKASASSPSWSPQAPELHPRAHSTSTPREGAVWQWLPRGSALEESARSPSTGALQLSSTSRLSEPGAAGLHEGASSSSTTPLRGGPSSTRKAAAGGPAPLTARANYESALLSAVRRQIESFEEKVGGQISTLRCQQQRDRMREAAFSRLEDKMGALEGAQPKFEQRLAELTGNFKGLSDEMQAQIRRVDLVDDRLWEWRHQLEEEFQQKYTDFEQSVHKVCSGVRVMASANEEGQKSLVQRVLALEAEARERHAQPRIHPRDFQALRERLEAVEGRCQGLEAIAEETSTSMLSREQTHVREVDSMEEAANAALLGLLERRVGDIGEKLDRDHQDLREAYGKLAVQEEQLRSMRTLLDNGEERNRALLDRFERSDLEGRLEQLRQAALEEARQSLELRERLELLGRRLDYQDQVFEDLRQSQLRTPRDASPGALHSSALSQVSLQTLQCRLLDVEAHLGVMQTEFEALREDANLAPRVGELVGSLKEVMPKVVAHDRAIQELQDGREGSFRPLPAGGLAAISEGGDRLEELLALREKVSVLDTEGAEVQGRLAELAANLLEVSQKQAELQVSRQEPHELQSSRAPEESIHLSGFVSQRELEERLGVLRSEFTNIAGEAARSAQEPVEKLMHMASSSQEAASCVMAEFQTLVHGLQDCEAAPDAALREELVACAKLSADSKELAADVLGELIAFRREFKPSIEAEAGAERTLSNDKAARVVSFSSI